MSKPMQMALTDLADAGITLGHLSDARDHVEGIFPSLEAVREDVVKDPDDEL